MSTHITLNTKHRAHCPQLPTTDQGWIPGSVFRIEGLWAAEYAVSGATATAMPAPTDRLTRRCAALRIERLRGDDLCVIGGRSSLAPALAQVDLREREGC